MMDMQLSMYDMLFPKENRSIIVKVERPNGTTFNQEIKLENGESAEDAVKKYQKRLGDPYGWKTVRGQKLRYIKKDAYLVVDWHTK